MAFDLDRELLLAIKIFEARYGNRDPRFQIIPVSFHDRPYAQTIVDDIACTLAVKLDVAAMNDNVRLKYQIWHEAVHCLAPVNSMHTLWFEEGLAVESCLYAPHMSEDYRQRCIGQLKPFPAWNDPWQCFRELNATDEQVRAAHERAPQRQFDQLRPDLIIEIFGAAPSLAAYLCKRLGSTREVAT
jgi:hypothetical protein